MKLYSISEKTILQFLSNSFVKNLFLFFIMLVGLSTFAQKKNVATKTPIQAVAKVNTTVADEIAAMKILVPHNYTATKVLMPTNFTPAEKQEFIKKHGQEFYFIYSNEKGKQISAIEFQEALRKEEDLKAASKNLINSKK